MTLKQLQDQLVLGKQEIKNASVALQGQQIEVSRLIAENAKLKTSLEEASTASPAIVGMAELQERVTGE